MSKIEPILGKKWIYHSLFWLVIYGLFVTVLSTQYSWNVAALAVGSSLTAYIPIVYINFLWLVPSFLFKRDYKRYFIYLPILIISYSPLVVVLNKFNSSFLLEDPEKLHIALWWLNALLNLFFILLLTTGLKLAKNWFEQRQKKPPSGRSIRYDPILRERPLDYKYSSTISPDSPEYCLALLHNQRGADALLYFGS